MPRNEFKAAKGTRDVRKRCGLFKMSASSEEDEEFLAHLYRTIWLQGGSVTIDDGEVQMTYNFFK